MGNQSSRGGNPRKPKKAIESGENGAAKLHALPKPAADPKVKPVGAATTREEAEAMSKLINEQLFAIFRHHELPAFQFYFTIPIVGWKEDLKDPKTGKKTSGWGFQNVYHTAISPCKSQVMNSAVAIISQEIPKLAYGIVFTNPPVPPQPTPGKLIELPPQTK